MRRGETRLIARARGHYPGHRLPSRRLPGLRSIGYWDAVGPQSWGLPMHRNEGLEICYLLSGETAFATDEEEVLMQPGEITVTRPWQRHRVGDPNIRACRLFWTILDVESGEGQAAWALPSWIGPDDAARREILRVLRRNQRCHATDEELELKSFLTRACRHLDETEPLLWSHLATTVNQLLLSVVGILAKECDGHRFQSDGFHQTVRGFFRGLEGCVQTAAEPWSVEDMARACRVGVTYLTQASRELFNSTPSEHLCRIRLAHAARLLRTEPESSVTDIAFRTGFNSSQYFATRFRRNYGATPRDYRRSAS